LSSGARLAFHQSGTTPVFLFPLSHPASLFAGLGQQGAIPMRKTISILTALFFPALMFLAPCAAHAQPLPGFPLPLPFVQFANLLTISATASDEVQSDSVIITLYYEQESNGPKALSAALNQHLNAALQKAKNVSAVNVSTGESTQFMSSASSHGTQSVWRGRVQISLESKDVAAASKLAGELASDMQVGNVQFALSPQAQRAVEGRLSRRAIASLRKKAAAAVRALGYHHDTLRQVSVTVAPAWGVAGAQKDSTPENGSLANLSLKGQMSTVTVTATGIVQME
jgi:predicted secreted protein